MSAFPIKHWIRFLITVMCWAGFEQTVSGWLVNREAPVAPDITRVEGLVIGITMLITTQSVQYEGHSGHTFTIVKRYRIVQIQA